MLKKTEITASPPYLVLFILKLAKVAATAQARVFFGAFYPGHKEH